MTAGGAACRSSSVASGWATRFAPRPGPYTGRPARACEIGPDRVAWRRRARLLAFPPSVEYRILRSLCELSPRVQRRLFGPPPEIDGQVLAPDVNVILKLADRAGENSLTGGLPPKQARAKVRRRRRSSDGPPIPMAELLEFELPGADGPLTARLYVPHGAPPPPRPMLVHFHGGGWMVGDLETHDSACRFLAAHSGVGDPLDDLPARPRASLPGRGRRRAGLLPLGQRARRRARRRPGQDRGRRRLAPAPTWRPASASRCATRAARTGDAVADLPGDRSDRPAALAGALRRRLHAHPARHRPLRTRLPPGQGDGLRPARLGPARPRPLRPAPRLRRHRRLRPAARRGRGVRGAAARRRGAGGPAPPPAPRPQLRQHHRGLALRAGGDAGGGRRPAHGPRRGALRHAAEARYSYWSDSRTSRREARRAGAIAARTPAGPRGSAARSASRPGRRA